MRFLSILLALWTGSAIAANSILVPERSTNTLYIFKGGHSEAERNWNRQSNILWQMPLKNAKGVPKSEMRRYNRLWVGKNSLNDAKRVDYGGKVHIAVTGNGGNSVALIDYDSKRVVYWSGTRHGGPHDVDLAPGGYLIVANPNRNGSFIEIYDTSKPNNSGAQYWVEHPGVHAVQWDHKKGQLWAWGQKQFGLRSYRLIISDQRPRLVKMKTHAMPLRNFEVGMAHGAAPKIVANKRYLLLSAKSGILQFDTDTERWQIIKRAPNDKGLYRGVKGLSYNNETGEIIFTRSWSTVLSLSAKERSIKGAGIYKARWWQENLF